LTSALSVSRRKLVSLFAGTITALILTISLLPSTAVAGSYTSFGGNLSPKSWTTNGAVGELYDIAAEIQSGPTAVCIGPVQKSGSGYVFPYGWSCGSFRVSWEFATIWAAPGVDNPNSQWFHFSAIGYFRN
jgi:hypothetical protein